MEKNVKELHFVNILTKLNIMLYTPTTNCNIIFQGATVQAIFIVKHVAGSFPFAIILYLYKLNLKLQIYISLYGS